LLLQQQAVAEKLNVRDLVREYNRNYSFDELIQKPPPRGLDKTKLEKYLPDEEFEKRFEMNKDKFYEMPAWKQNNKRKEVGLY